MIEISRKRIDGVIDAIPSKSYAHRALICAALADGRSELIFSRTSVDIETTKETLRALGAVITDTDTGCTVDPIQDALPGALLDCRESGSTLRFMLPVAAGLTEPVHFTGTGRLPERPLSPLLEQMEEHGCRFSACSLPLTIHGRLRGGKFSLPGDISSQYVSGLLLAAPVLGETEVHLTSRLESEDYVHITTDVMESFGVATLQTDTGFRVPRGAAYRANSRPIEGDWSNAAFFLVGAALSGRVSLRGLKEDSVQGDRGILGVLKAFGAKVVADGAVTVEKDRMQPFRLDLSRMPDSLPALAVLAAGARGDSVFTGGRRLRFKESDRLHTTATMLHDLGGRATETEDGLIVHGTGSLSGGTTSSFGDHRLAMAAATASVLCEQPVRIENEEAVTKSYPAFFEDLERIGGGHV